MSSSTTLTLDAAREIIAGSRAAARERRLEPLAYVVLDAGGNLVAVEREDGASIGRVPVAQGKAYGAVALGVGSRSLMARADQQAYFIASATAALDGRLVPVPGGVLILDAAGGAVLGAVGASGDNSDNDEAAVVAGITHAGLVAKVD